MTIETLSYPTTSPNPATAFRQAAEPLWRQDTLAVAIIARDEAQNLRELLPTLDWADEVVVLVDAASQDDTAEVARQHGARVAQRAFDNFAAQRNAAVELCQSDWILSLDADERPSLTLSDEIRAVVQGGSSTAFRVRIESCIFGRRVRFGGTQNDRPVRLFRRGFARWHGDVHETLHVVGQVGSLRASLAHHTLSDLPAFLRKMQHYTALEAATRVSAHQRPWRGERWWAAGREVFRRLIWKHGWLDGPTGWAFCLLSGLSAWVAVDRTLQAFAAQRATASNDRAGAPDAA